MHSEPKEPEVVPLDLGRNAHGDPEAASPLLTQVGISFGRELRKVLPSLTRQRARVVPGEAMRAFACEAPAEGPSFLIRLNAAAGPWAALHLDANAILGLLDGLFGRANPEAGDEDEIAPDESKPSLGDALTLAQRALLRRVGSDLAQALVTPIEKVCRAKLALCELVCLKRDQSPDLPYDALALDLRIEDVPLPWAIRLHMGADALEALTGKPSGPARAEFQAKLAAATLQVPVRVTAELGRVTLKLSQVLGLRPGDTLRLPSAANDPVLVRVEGVAKFDAVPVISRGQVAVKIHCRHEP